MGPVLRIHEVGLEKWRTYLRVSRLRAEAQTASIRRLSREWVFLKNAVLARLRGDTILFEIGKPFLMGDRVWICTDVGSRTICAVLLDDLLRSGDSGPPYSICETVLDRYDMDGCESIR